MCGRWLILMLVLLTATCLVKGAAQDSPALKKSAKVKVTVADKKEPVKTWTVEGWGKTVEDAEKHALKNAVDMVGAYLKKLQPPLEWMPAAAEIHKNLFTGSPQFCANQEKQIVDGEQVQCWSWTVSLTSTQLEKMRREDNLFRARRAVDERSNLAAERMAEMTQLIVVLIIGLGGIWLVSRAVRGKAK